MRKQYRVRWEIDVDAGSAVEAARLALAEQRDLDSFGTVFEVFDETGELTVVDLLVTEHERLGGGTLRDPVGAIPVFTPHVSS